MGWDVFGFFVENVVIEYGELFEVWIRRFIVVIRCIFEFCSKVWIKKNFVYVFRYLFNF